MDSSLLAQFHSSSSFSLRSTSGSVNNPRAVSSIDNIVFFGTPHFAVPTLDALEAAGRMPSLVVTQPSRPAGRGRGRRAPPVLEWAKSRSVETIQTRTVKASSFLERMDSEQPDLVVVVAFGQIFPERLLEIPAVGCMNLHASLLPAYRGASPISAAIAAGESETGVTTMKMDAGLDSGPLYLQRSVQIEPDETTGDLSSRLATAGGELVVETIEALAAGKLEPGAQDHSLASTAPRLDKSDGAIRWQLAASRIFDHVRAMSPWPVAYTVFRGAPLRVHAARAWPAGAPGPESGEPLPPPGRYVGVFGGEALVSCADGVLGLSSVQRPGRKAISGADFVNGEQPELQERFGACDVS